MPNAMNELEVSDLRIKLILYFRYAMDVEQEQK